MATTTPDIRPVTPASLRRLAELETEGPFLSAFIDLDPERFATPPARESQLNSLLHSVSEELDAKQEGNGEQRAAAELQMEQLRSYVHSDDFPPSGATGAAVFIGRDLFEVYPLRRSVGPSATIADRPMYEEILPDAEMGPPWIVVLVNRELARLFVGRPDMLRERADVVDEVHGKHEQGGWSQSRYQRSIEEDVADHLRRTVDELEKLDRRSTAAGIVVGAGPEVWATLEGLLPKALGDRVVERIDIDVETATPEEIFERIEPIVAAERARLEASVVEELEMRVGRGERVAVGLEDVRKALFEKRVDRVLYDEGFDVPADVVSGTLEQSATLVSIAGDALDRHGRIAALLRF